jgi:hypothetical protein
MELDRIDNDGNYEPGNCRWATHAEHSTNKSTTRWVVLNGETMCFLAAAARLRVSATTMQSWRRSKGISHQATVDHYSEQRRSQ